MQSGDTHRDETRPKPKNTEDASANNQVPWRVPQVVQRLFDRFPLRVYPSNELPLRSPRNRTQNVLYTFTTTADAALGAPSYNPGCLKWQTLLNFHEIPFHIVASSNHASPSGALPFLLPASAPTASANPPRSPDPIPSSKLETWLQSQHRAPPSSTAAGDTASARTATYSALLSHTVRLAYLYVLYLHPATFTSTASPLYIAPSSRSSLVRLALEQPLRAAALSELLATTSGPVPRIDVERLLLEADGAFGALSALLGDSAWLGAGAPASESAMSSRNADGRGASRRSGPSNGVAALADELDMESQQRTSGFGLFDDGENGNESDGRDNAARQSRQRYQHQHQQPGMLDAALFAYSHVILLLFAREDDGSPGRRLFEAVERRPNLVEHRERVLRHYFTAYFDVWMRGEGHPLQR